MRTREERDREFARIFTSKMYAGNRFHIDDRMNSVGRLLIECFNRIRELEDRLEYLRSI